MKKIYLFLVFLAIVQGIFAQDLPGPAPGDPLGNIFSRLNITENDLGFRPKSYWTRYPVPTDIPFKNLLFDDLFAEPGKIFDYVRNMALSVDDFFNPEYLKSNHNAIMKVGYYCGVVNATSQFRAYNASLWGKVPETEPLLNVIKEIYQKTNTVYTYNRMEEAADFPLTERDLKKSLAGLHPEIQKVMAYAMLNLYDAWYSCRLSRRNIDEKNAEKVWRIRHLGETQFDGMGYYPEMEDLAKTVDMNSIYYAGFKIMEISEWLADTLGRLREKRPDINWKKQNFNAETPIGRIVVSGTGNDVHHETDAILVVDLGGDDSYTGPSGSTPSLQIPVSLVIDLEGNDTYSNDDEYLPSQGAAILGAAMLLDVRGNDSYLSKRLSQGAAMFGIGILADLEGNDSYKMWTDGQGSAYFGVGLAIDNSGDDNYYLFGDGQGYGGMGGIGALVNRTGNDVYKAEADTSIVYRTDYWHSKNGQYNYTYAQGCGIGRRGDITDGHSWAGGMGILIDLRGDDQYLAGGWSQACGYWYGLGFLYDEAGNDQYKATHWSQSCGAHFAISGLFDLGGNDQFRQWEKLSAGMGFGHDYTVALFYNKGGNDVYLLHDDGLGYAINKSQVLFIDDEGNDTYIRGGSGHNYGWNNYTSNNPPGVDMIYHLYSNQVAVFADINGNDTYFTRDFESNKDKADTLMADGTEILFPDEKQKEKLASPKYYGIGKDFSGWTGGEIEMFRDKMKKKYPEFK